MEDSSGQPAWTPTPAHARVVHLETPPDTHFETRVPDGDDRPRLVCRQCEWVHYQNPKIIVGAVATWKEKILLCRRAIEPRVGFWTIPAGYMEEGESAEHGAAREVWEEARARIQINALLATYSIAHISQVQLIYRATMLSDAAEPGPESLEVAFFSWDEIPWDHLSFRSVKWALEHYHQSRDQQQFAPFTAPAFTPPQKKN